MKSTHGILLIVFLFFSHFSFAQEDVVKHPLLTDRFVFTGGLFLPTKEVQISVNGKSIDHDIDLGKAFDIKKYQRTFNFGFDWRFAKKWKLSADVFNVRTLKVAELPEPIEWEDYIFDGRAELEMNLSVIRTMVSRLISTGDKHELGIGIGFHIMPVYIAIEGEAALIDPEDEIYEPEFEKQSVSVTAPLPDVGLYYHWAPTPKWYFGTSVDFLYIAIGDYKGWLWDFNAGVKYQIVDFFGVGINYKYYSVDLEVEQGNEIGEWSGALGLSYSGPLFLVHFNF